MLVNPGPLVFGTITVGALLGAESARSETYLETVGAVLIALVLYWLAHSYAELTARRFEQGHRLKPRVIGETMAHELAVVTGAAPSLVAVLICWAAGAGLGAAVNAGIWTSVGMVVLVELVAGVRAQLSAGALAVQIMVGALFGGLIIAMKVVLH